MNPVYARAVVTLLLLAACFSPAAAQWTTEEVTAFGNHADLAVDASGNPHVLFNNCVAWELCQPNGPRELTYAVKTGGLWSYETVAGDPMGFLTAIVVDDTGQPHIAYCDSTRQMHYGYRDGGAWPLEDLDHAVLLRYRASPSLTLDSSREPHIAFIERESVQYQRRVGGVWQDEDVTNSWLDNWSARAAIAVDSQDSVRVGTWNYYASAVLYTRAGPTWDANHVGGEIGYNPWMVLDANDDVHFVYHGGGVFYATNAGGGWSEEMIDASGSNQPDDIALDSTGRPMVVYTRATVVQFYPLPTLYDVEVRVAVRQPSGWQSQLVAAYDSAGTSRTDPRIEIDGFDTVHLLFREPDTGALRYGTRAIPLPVGTQPPAVTRPLITHLAPNPFNPDTEIAFRVASIGPVSLRVYDVTGRLVQTIMNTTLPRGDYTARWNGATRNGIEAPSGVYFFRLETAGGTHTRRGVLAK